MSSRVFEVLTGAPEGRFNGIQRNYTPEFVLSRRLSLPDEYALARHFSNLLWERLHATKFIRALGAMDGWDSVEQIRGGLLAIYLSGWQVAAGANLDRQVYTDQSRYSSASGPALCREYIEAMKNLERTERARGGGGLQWYAPIVADAEAGFGGPLHVMDLVEKYIAAGAAAVHLEDQVAAEKKCGHMGGKVLVPTRIHVRNLLAARIKADILGVPTLVIARTDAESAKLISSDIDERDHRFIESSDRSWEGYYWLKDGSGVEHSIARALAYAPYADLLWMETSTPDIGVAREFAQAVHAEFPGKLLAYNCSPSFHWRRNLDEQSIATFQEQLADMGFKFQFITLAGFHSRNAAMFGLAKGYAERGMAAYSELQTAEFEYEKAGYGAVRHQEAVGGLYVDSLVEAITDGLSSTTAMKGSTELAQFQH